MLIAQILAGKGSEIISTRADATIASVARLLKQKRIGALVVTDAGGGLCGTCPSAISRGASPTTAPGCSR